MTDPILTPTMCPTLGNTFNFLPSPLLRGVRAWYPCHEGTGYKLYDVSGNGSVAEDGNQYDFWNFGKAGVAVKSRDHYDSANNYLMETDLTPTESFTWSIWFWVDNNHRTYNTLLSYISSYNLFDIYKTTSYYTFSIWNETSGGSNMGFGQIDYDDKWHHAVYVREGNNITDGYKVYFDGQQSPTPHNTGTRASSNFIWIANRENNASQRFAGYFANVMIYDRALSPEEVNLLYLMGNNI